MKTLVVVAAALVGGGAAALLWIYLESQPYYGVVRVRAPGEITYTALFHGKADRELCEGAASRFEEHLAQACPQCRVELSRCARSAAEPGDAAYWVSGRTVRIAIAGPEASARASCEVTARELAGRCEKK